MPAPLQTSAGLLLVLVLTLMACRTEPAPGEPPPMKGQSADFTLPDLDGGVFSLSAQRGTVIILNFWATWCAPCIIEVPELMAVHQDLADQNVMVVGVSQDTGSTAHGEVRDFAERFDVNYPLVLDTNLTAGQAYGVNALPTTLIIDRDGEVRRRKAGLVNRADLLAMLEGLVELPQTEAASSRLRSPRSTVDPKSDLDPPDDAYDEPFVAAVSAEEAGELFDAGVMVVDLRTDDDRATNGDIPFSMVIALEHFERTSLPANFAAPVVFVASEDDLAWQAAERAAHWGYVFAHPVTGGFDAWRDAGLPVEFGHSVSRGLRKL